MKELTFSPLFRKFLISYLIILTIPNIAGYMSYRAAINVVQSSSIENSILLLEQSKEILEQRFTEVSGFAKQLAMNHEMISLMSEEKEGDFYNVYGLWKIARHVSTYGQTNDFLRNFYIYFNNYNAIVTPGVVYLRTEHYYELNHFSEDTFEQWQENILTQTHQDEIIPLRPYLQDKRQSSVVTYVQSLPLNSFSKSMATVVVIIDEDKIVGLLESMTSQNKGWVFIADENGNTLASQNIEQSDVVEQAEVPTGEDNDIYRFQNDTLLISVRSAKTGWVYTAGIPEQHLMVKPNKIKYLTWSLTGTALLIGLCIGLLLAYRNSAPIHRLSSVFDDQFESNTGRVKNEIDYLAGNISNLISNNKRLKTELDGQMPLLRDAFIKRLLVGDIISSQEVDALSSQTGVALQSHCGYAGLIRINGYGGLGNEEIIQELNAARYILKQSLQTLDLDLILTDWGSDKVAVLFPVINEKALKKEREVMNQVIQRFNRDFAHYRIPIHVTMGAPYYLYRDISRSFEEAERAMEYTAETDEQGIVWFQDTIKKTALYYYPIDTMQRLFNTIKAGEAEEGKRILTQVLVHNFEERELSYEMKQQFIIELKGTLLKVVNERIIADGHRFKSIKNEILQIQPTDGIEQLKQSMLDIVEKICHIIAEKKKELNCEIIRLVNEYVEKRYGNSDLTLYQISDFVGRPEKYISQVYKDYTGNHLSDYIEQVRITKATELLKKGDITIDEISEQTGYNSAHSFRRAFKRVKGIPPSAFRHSIL